MLFEDNNFFPRVFIFYYLKILRETIHNGQIFVGREQPQAHGGPIFAEKRRVVEIEMVQS